jgi:acyl transferase domain-containing protein
MTKEGVKTGLEVAVIGMAGRFPGAPGIDIFWDNLRSGVESISFFSQKELEGSGINPLWLEDSNYVRARGILDNADCFDAGFFGYSPHESILMDPQIRIFHECCWEALEHAGYNPEACKGNIGLYAGASAN